MSQHFYTLEEFEKKFLPEFLNKLSELEKRFNLKVIIRVEIELG